LTIAKIRRIHGFGALALWTAENHFIFAGNEYFFRHSVRPSEEIQTNVQGILNFNFIMKFQKLKEELMCEARPLEGVSTRRGGGHKGGETEPRALKVQVHGWLKHEHQLNRRTTEP